jgi:hypothetical protein
VREEDEVEEDCSGNSYSVAQAEVVTESADDAADDWVKSGFWTPRANCSTRRDDGRLNQRGREITDRSATLTTTRSWPKSHNTAGSGLGRSMQGG